MDKKSRFGEHPSTLVQVAVDRRIPAINAQHRVSIQMMRCNAQEDFAVTGPGMQLSFARLSDPTHGFIHLKNARRLLRRRHLPLQFDEHSALGSVSEYQSRGRGMLI